jgi:hypothetical protein
MSFTAPEPCYTHLERLTDACSVFEHALFAAPRVGHGYCVDDASRALVVVCREPFPTAAVQALANRYLTFVLDAVEPDGRCHNRMDVGGLWQDCASLGDWWGRALWGLGVAAVSAHSTGMRARALTGFRIAAQRRSPHPRAMAFAALGAAEVLQSRPDELAARALLVRATRPYLARPLEAEWPWPETRLTYANAALAEAMICAGGALGDPVSLARGVQMLDFLLTLEMRDGHLSVTPVGGRGQADHGEQAPRFDQQPIEVASLADACATAFRITGEDRWLDAIKLAWTWFLGDNDTGTQMFDSATGGGYDGLQAVGRNLNQGAESTLAMLSTAQLARRFLGNS